MYVFFLTMTCAVKMRNTNASGLQAYFLSQRLDGQECCSGLSTDVLTLSRPLSRLCFLFASSALS